MAAREFQISIQTVVCAGCWGWEQCVAGNCMEESRGVTTTLTPILGDGWGIQ